MSAKRKIKKLKKGYIWPSILILLISLFLSMLLAAINIGVLFDYILESKLDRVVENITRSEELLKKSGAGSLWTLIENPDEELVFIESAVLLDQNDKVLAQVGRHQWSGRYESAITDETGNYTAYLEEGMGSVRVGANGNLGLSLTAFMREMDNIVESEEEDITAEAFRNRPILTVSFWVEPLGFSERGRLLIRQSVSITQSEALLLVFVGVATVALVGIVVLLLFINVVVNVLNQRRTVKLFYTDPVTGGNNRQYIYDYGNSILRSWFGKSKHFSVVDLELMHYQHYCLCHGAKEGEQLLEKLNKYLSKQLKHGEKCAHLGEGRFALLIRCEHDAEDTQRDCESRIMNWLETFAQTFDCSSLTFHAGMCHMFSEHNFETCFNNSASACAAIGADQGNTLICFGEELKQQQLWEHEVEERMQAALDNQEFQVYFQPKYHPVTEELSGAEALVRWINPELGFVSPGRFIPIFEKNGFITKLDDYMVSHVAQFQAKWLAEGKQIVPVSVNVSRAHFADPDLAKELCRMVDAYNVPRKYIEIELTESAFFDDKKLLSDTVMKLKEYGFTISMDDFGAGYSSLNSLKDLPLDILKLDAEFFRGENADDRGEIVVSRVIKLAKDLNMRIVAEGIEEKEQVEFLAGQGCDMIQGFYFAKPMPAQDYETRMK